MKNKPFWLQRQSAGRRLDATGTVALPVFTHRRVPLLNPVGIGL
jgi:hypothetical protein